MKYSLIACLMLCFSLSFAQSDLFVSSGSYVYVDGTAFSSGPTVAPLYVTDDVNIANNGNIYLRNEAQLLQGNDVGNSGQGELSIYQEGNTNQWAYNYWCSPVGGTLSNTSINNAFRIDQIDDPLLGTTDPIDSGIAGFITGYNGTASPLTISTRWLWMFVSSDEYSEWLPAGSSGDITSGLGFTMKGSGTGLTGSTSYDFRGKPNNGTIGSPVAVGNFTLVGNPYPSAIDSAAFIHDTQNQAAITAGTLFYWEQDGSIGSHVLQDYIGGYYEFTINAAGTLITDTPAVFMTYDEQDNQFPLALPANGIKTAGRYIPIGQGFMVEGSIGTSGTIRAKNVHRTYQKEGAQSNFFRNSSEETSTTSGIQYQDNGLAIVPNDYKRFRINIDFSANESQYTRQMVLNFHDTATAGFDYGLELSRSDNFPSDSYFTLDGKAYSGQAYPFEESLTIPLVVDIEEQQPLRFRIFDIQNFDESQGIYIHDIEDDIYVNLRDQNYDLNIEPGNYTDRFEIVFTNQALGIDEFDKNTLAIHQNNNNHQLSVLNPNSLDIKSIAVYDVAGKRLIQSQHDDAILNRYELSTVNLSDGVYVVNVLSHSNNTIKSQKIIVKN